MRYNFLIISKQLKLLLLDWLHCLMFFLLLYSFSDHRILVQPFISRHLIIINHSLIELRDLRRILNGISFLPWFTSFIVTSRLKFWLKTIYEFFFLSIAFVFNHFLFCFSPFFNVLAHPIEKLLLLLFCHFLAKVLSLSLDFHNFKFFSKLLKFLFFKNFLITDFIFSFVSFKKGLNFLRGDLWLFRWFISAIGLFCC